MRVDQPPPEPREQAELRAVNERIGQAYDAVPYDPPAKQGLDPQRIFGLAALYGCAESISRKFDVLDLGCGTGRLLESLGSQTGGRLVGVDISREACARAEQRCAKFADRARIMRTDFLALSASDLGHFDLIYHIGVIYVTPASVQRHILAMIAGCLKPAGVAVVSYYAGTLPRLRAALHRALRAVNDTSQPREIQIREARERVREIGDQIPHADPFRDMIKEAVRQTASLDDITFFHEVLNQTFDALQTSTLAAAMAEHGLRFLNYTMPTRFGTMASLLDRALAADTLDLAGGGYRYAMFSR